MTFEVGMCACKNFATKDTPGYEYATGAKGNCKACKNWEYALQIRRPGANIAADGIDVGFYECCKSTDEGSGRAPGHLSQVLGHHRQATQWNHQGRISSRSTMLGFASFGLTAQREPSARSATAEVEWIATSANKASSRGTDGGCKSRHEREKERG
jgi:hypothetical protein